MFSLFTTVNDSLHFCSRSGLTVAVVLNRASTSETKKKKVAATKRVTRIVVSANGTVTRNVLAGKKYILH